MDQLVAGSGWSNMFGIHLNDVGSFIGYGSIGGGLHTFIVTATFPPDIREVLVAQILVGVINDAGGIFFIGGRGHRVPPGVLFANCSRPYPNASVTNSTRR